MEDTSPALYASFVPLGPSTVGLQVSQITPSRACPSYCYFLLLKIQRMMKMMMMKIYLSSCSFCVICRLNGFSLGHGCVHYQLHVHNMILN